MSDKVIITDIDSTMSDHWKRIRRNTVPRWPGGSIDPKAFSREEIMKDALLPFCRSTLINLQIRGYYIRYLSARDFTHARAVTVEQLGRWDVPNPQDVILVANILQKVEVLNRNICWIYIDDFTTGQENNIGSFHAEAARAIQQKGVHVIVFRNDWLDVLEQIDYYETGRWHR